jgi:Domain of unknown function (DUF4124)
MKSTRTTFSPARPLVVALAIAALVFSTSASAQYMWLDAAGHKVFSDQPPPANIPAKRILQQPGKAAPTSAATGANKANEENDADSDKTAAKAKADASKAAASKDKDVKDKELEAAKKKLDDAAAAKKKEEQEARDAARADNCVRAKQAKATFDSGIRLSSVNAKGERVVMDDATRMVESKRVEGIIATDCKVN